PLPTRAPPPFPTRRSSDLLAPGAALDVVIGSRQGNIPEALIAAIESRAGDVVSLSFGLCEQAAPVVTTELFDAFYAVANSQGQTDRKSTRLNSSHEWISYA